jgi:hypothetical protein
MERISCIITYRSVDPKATKDLVTALAFSLFGMMNWIYSWYDPRKSLKPNELSNLIFQVFTKGVDGAVF